jgi:hypothetical protein
MRNSKLYIRIVLALALILSMFSISYGQAGSIQPTATPTNMTSKYYKYLGYVGVDSGLFIPSRDTVFTPTGSKAAITRRTQDGGYYGYDSISSSWQLINSNFFVKITTQNPTASLSGGSNYELHSAGTFSPTLNYSAGRLAATSSASATAPIASITVASVSEPVSGCSTAPCTINGTQLVTVTYNTNTIFSNVVVTTDSKSVTVNTSFNFYSTYYRGYVSSSSPTDANLYTAGYNFLNTSNSKSTSGTLSNPSSASYIVFAYPSRFGTATISINGLGVNYNLTTRSVTNQSGYTETYNIYVSPFATSAGVTFVVN